MRKVVCICIGLLYACLLPAQIVQDSVKIHFRQGKHRLEHDFKSNKQALEKIDRSVLRLERIEVVGGASPEGSVPLNKRLSERRARVLFDYLSRYGSLPDSLKTTRFLGRDWRGLLRLVEADPQVPYQQESAEFIRNIIREVESGKPSKSDPFWRLVAFREGEPYRYMYYNLFPDLRATRLNLWFREVPKPIRPVQPSLAQELPAPLPLLQLPAPVPSHEPSPVYWALKTNLLYDAVLVPNVGVEVYLGKNWSAGANWMYAWWKHDHKHWYWRIYGGDVNIRKWFGKKAEEKPLTGHHIGIYAQMLTYDFETGGRGYMGGKPGGNLWDKAHWGAGIEYGYSHPIGRRLNLDFTLGVGYLGGEYHEYIPEDDCYVWQATKKRNWIGPTKAEVSLVWLLGRGNYNKQKGGRR